jgi:hypothetical protein
VWEENILRMFENSVMRICGPKQEEVRGDQRHSHSMELRDFCASYFVSIIGSRRMGWVWHITHMGMMRAFYFFFTTISSVAVVSTDWVMK